jgi:SET domain-containing protein
MTDSTPKKRSTTPSTLPFELRQSPIQGQGAFATRPIKKGTRIIEYAGERISQDEADVRYDDESMKRHHTFLFTLDEDTVIDAAVGGNEARFINHSCDPNCQAFIEGDRIFIYSIRPIEQGEELCYDYAYERVEGMDEESEKLYVCRCGAKSCRGTILAPPKPPKRARPAKATKAAKSTKRSSKGGAKKSTRAKDTRKQTAKRGKRA